MADDFNQFYCRFDQPDFLQERKERIAGLTPMASTIENLELQQAEVELMLRRTKQSTRT